MNKCENFRTVLKRVSLVVMVFGLLSLLLLDYPTFAEENAHDSTSSHDPIIGTWKWAWTTDPTGTPEPHGTVIIKSDHTMTFGNKAGNWKKESEDTYKLTWHGDKSTTDTMTLSDKNTLEGSNDLQWKVKGTR